MSRIQEFLKKAERDGSIHRTRAIGADGAPSATALAEQPPAAPTRRSTARATLPAAPARPPPSRGPRRAGDARSRACRRARRRSRWPPSNIRSLRTRVKTARERPGPARDHHHQPEQGGRQEPHRRQPRADDGAGVPAARAPGRRRPAAAVDPPPVRHRARRPGLSDVLMGGATLDDALVAMPEHRLTILPSGVIPTHPAELLGSAAMRRVLDTLRTRFDRILIDMPPVAPLADVAIASAHGRRRPDDRPRRRDAEAGDRARAVRARHVQGPGAGPERRRRHRRG